MIRIHPLVRAVLVRPHAGVAGKEAAEIDRIRETRLPAYRLYRWENSIRMANLLGFVDGGGLGRCSTYPSAGWEAQATTGILAVLLLALGGLSGSVGEE